MGGSRRVELGELVKETSRLGPPLVFPGNLDALGGFWEARCWDSRGSCMGATTVGGPEPPSFGPKLQFLLCVLGLDGGGVVF